MGSNINLSLIDDLRFFIDDQSGDGTLYLTSVSFCEIFCVRTRAVRSVTTMLRFYYRASTDGIVSFLSLFKTKLLPFKQNLLTY